MRKTTKVERKALNVLIPEEVYEKLKDEAAERDISLATLVKLICAEHFGQKNAQ